MSDQAEQLRKIMSSTKQVVDKQTSMKIITIASGKGGVGKSNFVVNLALCLQQQNKNPIILDADFGLANVEIILGERPKYNLSHLIKGECELKDLISKSKYNLSFISGGSGINEMIFLPKHKIEEIGKSLAQLEDMTDILLIDTGAGINDVVLKFCMLAHEIYIIVTPEPTSITDAYALIKTLTNMFTAQLSIKIVINKAAAKEEAYQVFHKLYYVSKSFLNTEIEYVGFIPYDDTVLNAVKKQVPVFLFDKKSKASQAYYAISKNLCGDNKNQAIASEEKVSWITKFKRIFSN